MRAFGYISVFIVLVRFRIRICVLAVEAELRSTALYKISRAVCMRIVLIIGVRFRVIKIALRILFYGYSVQFVLFRCQQHCRVYVL